jgi:hypothetical protein
MPAGCTGGPLLEKYFSGTILAAVLANPPHQFSVRFVTIHPLCHFEERSDEKSLRPVFSDPGLGGFLAHVSAVRSK